MIRLVADENIAGLDRLPAEDLEIVPVNGRSLTASQLIAADALWVRSVTRVDAPLLEGTSLRFMGTATAGLEHIDTALLARRGISFSAAPGANANSVVEYVLAALLELGTPWGRLEAGGTLGIVGYGHVGRRLAQVARRLGWSLRICDPWVEQDDSGLQDGPVESVLPEFCALEEILDCTVISLHCSLHEQSPWPSRHLVGADALARLDGEQWLINAARGGVLDNGALLAHLRGQSPVNCVLDVWEGEPAFDVALLENKALRLATPHIAGYSWDAKWQATQMLYDAMHRAGAVSAPLVVDESDELSLQPVSGRGLTALRSVMEQRYWIREDDRHFRDLLRLSAQQRGAAFDRLRKNYRTRRELRGNRFDGASPNDADAMRFLRAVDVQLP